METSPETHQLIDNVYDRLVQLGKDGFGIVCLNPYDYATVRKIGRDRMHTPALLSPIDGLAAQLMGQVIPPGEGKDAPVGDDTRLGPVCTGVWVCQNSSVPQGSVRAAARLGDEWVVLPWEP